MSKRTQYFLQADFCKTMADKASSLESRERWLSLAAKWLTLADETYGNRLIEGFTARPEPAQFNS